MDYKVIDKIWFTPNLIHGCIGIITIEFELAGKVWQKVYMGIGGGQDEELDAEIIVRSGARFHGFTADIIKSKLVNGMD